MRKLAWIFLISMFAYYIVLPIVGPMIFNNLSEGSFWTILILLSMITPLILPCAVTAAIVYLVCSRKKK